MLPGGHPLPEAPEERHSEHLLPRVAEHLGHLPVDVRRPPFRVGATDTLLGGLDDLPVALLARAQLLLGPDPPGDVLEAENQIITGAAS